MNRDFNHHIYIPESIFFVQQTEQKESLALESEHPKSI